RRSDVHVPAALAGLGAARRPKGAQRAPAARGGESAVGLRPPTSVSSQALWFDLSTSPPRAALRTPYRCRGCLLRGRARKMTGGRGYGARPAYEAVATKG